MADADFNDSIGIIDEEHDYKATVEKRFRFSPRKNTLRILLLTIPLSIPAGAAIMPQRLFFGLLRKGFDVKVITHWWDCGFEPLVRYSVIGKEGYKTFFGSRDSRGRRLAEVKSWRTIKTSSGYKKIPSKIDIAVPKNSLRETSRKVARKALGYLSETDFRPDVIHIHTHTFMYDGTLHDILDFFGNPPVVYTLHAVIRKISRERERAQMNTVEISDRLVTISEGWKKNIENMYGKRCEYIHNATDYFMYTDDKGVEKRARELLNLLNPDGKRLLLFSGRVEEIKIQGLPKAFSDIADKWDTRLIIMGDSGGENTLRNLIKWGLKKQHLDRVIFAGWINGISEEGRREIAAYYKMMNIDNEINGVMVMPVRTEDHYGLSVLDAIAMKTPVITCKGRLATYGCLPDAESLKEAIGFVFSNPDKVRERADNAYMIAKKEYSIDRYYVPKHIDLYRSLILQPRTKNSEERMRKLVELVRRRKQEKLRRLSELVKIRRTTE